jgi:hypothetical protein
MKQGSEVRLSQESACQNLGVFNNGGTIIAADFTPFNLKETFFFLFLIYFVIIKNNNCNFNLKFKLKI